MGNFTLDRLGPSTASEMDREVTSYEELPEDLKASLEHWLNIFSDSGFDDDKSTPVNPDEARSAFVALIEMSAKFEAADPQFISDKIALLAATSSTYEGGLENPELQSSFMRALAIYHSDKLASTLVKVQRAAREDIQRYRQPKAESPEYSGFAKLLEHYDVSDTVARKILASWSSYNPIGSLNHEEVTALYGSLEQQQLATSSLENQISFRLFAQLKALVSYIERYGSEEAQKMHKTFGTCNFIRYSDGDILHEQLEQWSDTTKRPKKLVFSSTDDNNGALDKLDVPPSSDPALVTFLFEFSSRTELAKEIVAVGNRERQAGRDPLKEPTVEEVYISAHGNVGILQTGRGELITTKDFESAEASRKKLQPASDVRLQVGQNDWISSRDFSGAHANDFSKHLGNKYEIFLTACNTGVDVAKGMSLAQNLSNQVGITVHAPHRPVYGWQPKDNKTGDFMFEGRAGKAEDKFPATRFTPQN
jgi:hypothetical protein